MVLSIRRLRPVSSAISSDSTSLSLNNTGPYRKDDAFAGRLESVRDRFADPRYGDRMPFSLRPFSSSDAVAVLDAFCDPDMARQGDVTDPDQAQAQAWISAMAEGRSDRHVFGLFRINRGVAL